MKHLQTVDGFFNFCHKHHCTIQSLHCGNSVYYLAFYMGQAVAQYVEYIPFKSEAYKEIQKPQ